MQANFPVKNFSGVFPGRRNNRFLRPGLAFGAHRESCI